MIEFEIDDKKVEVAEGSMIIEAADAAGIYIPRFCYHKKLSIAANCRMCLVEVDKSKKPLPACATPVTPGMKVFTKSTMALDAQKSVMEFLLINHPLDCPICDQGGECELQDLSLGYGDDISRYNEGKRSVVDENLGPLIATDMTRCIQCTRCVRFGNEIAGMPELGATQRGENLEITTYINHTLKSELSGNIIDLCPVGALTSKPYRFTARPWELNQNPSISPHDCIGSNIFVHTRGYVYNDYRTVMRVVPRENETINETWISDRDRYSYEALRSPERLLAPKIKKDGAWITVDWSTALNFIVEKWRHIIDTHGSDQIAALASPNSTLEEFYLLQKLFRNLGSHNLDHRIRHLDFSQQEKYPTHPHLGMSLDAIETQKTIFIVGSDTRTEQPLGAHRIRKAWLKGANVICLNPVDYRFNFEPTSKLIVPPSHLPRVLGGIAKHLATKNKSPLDDPYFSNIEPTAAEKELAKALKKKNGGLLLLGNQAEQHPQATLIRALCQRIAAECDMTLGFFSQGANSAGGWLAGMLPHRSAGGHSIESSGLNAIEMFSHQLKSYLLLNLEPELDCAQSMQAQEALLNAEFVVAFTPFLTDIQEQYAHVILPVAPFFEISGTFINASDCWQSFEAVTRPLGDAKPAWKIFRVLGNLFGFEGFDYTHTSQVIAEVQSLIDTSPKSPAFLEVIENPTEKNADGLIRLSEWSIYQVDNLVRRAPSLQQWDQETNHAVIRINQEVADEYDYRSGEIVSVVQEEMLLNLPVVIDSTISGHFVVMRAGIVETGGFGQHWGSIKLLRGHGK